MKKNITSILSLVFLFNLFQTAYSQTIVTNTTTPIVPPTGKHGPAFEVKRHMGRQYKRIKKALAAKIITGDQAKTLRGQVTLVYENLHQDYVQNGSYAVTANQENQLFQMLTNSARAIDAAIGTSRSSTDPS